MPNSEGPRQAVFIDISVRHFWESKVPNLPPKATPPPIHKALIRPYLGPYLLGGWSWGGTLDSHELWGASAPEDDAARAVEEEEDEVEGGDENQENEPDATRTAESRSALYKAFEGIGPQKMFSEIIMDTQSQRWMSSDLWDFPAPWIPVQNGLGGPKGPHAKASMGLPACAGYFMVGNCGRNSSEDS